MEMRGYVNSPKQNNRMVYEKDYECCQKKLEKLEQTSNRVSFLRLITIAAAGVAFFLWCQRKTPAFLAFAFSFAFVFLMLIRYHGILEDEQTYLEDFQSVLKDYMARFDDGWKGFPMNGARYINDEMLESRDLDLFGKGSFYQYICTASTIWGQDQLAFWLQLPGRDFVHVEMKVLSQLSAVVSLCPPGLRYTPLNPSRDILAASFSGASLYFSTVGA